MSRYFSRLAERSGVVAPPRAAPASPNAAGDLIEEVNEVVAPSTGPVPVTKASPVVSTSPAPPIVTATATPSTTPLPIAQLPHAALSPEPATADSLSPLRTPILVTTPALALRAASANEVRNELAPLSSPRASAAPAGAPRIPETTRPIIGALLTNAPPPQMPRHRAETAAPTVPASAAPTAPVLPARATTPNFQPAPPVVTTATPAVTSLSPRAAPTHASRRVEAARAPTQVHIGRIQLEVVAPTPAPPSMRINSAPVPVETPNAPAPFNAHRHYLRGR